MVTLYSGVIVQGRVQLVRVEALLHRRAFPQFSITGLPQGAVRESKERVLSALKTCGVTLPRGRVVVNLSPPDIPKAGTTLDAAIAIALLQLTQKIPKFHCGVVGELGISGEWHRSAGSLLITKVLAERFPDVSILVSQEYDAAGLPLQARRIPSLQKLIQQPKSFLQTKFTIRDDQKGKKKGDLLAGLPDFDQVDIWSHAQILRLIEILLTGRHHAFLYGSPGQGKTASLELIRTLQSGQLTGSLAALRQGYRDLTQVSENVIVVEPPSSVSECFRHVSVNRHSQWGSLWQAQGGICVFDDAHHLQASVRSSLLGILSPSSPEAELTKAQCLFLANPCRCGYFGTARCQCSTSELQRFRQKFDIALLDRCALFARIEHANLVRISSDQLQETWKKIRKARWRQEQRYAKTGVTSNAELHWSHVEKDVLPAQMLEATKDWSHRRKVFLRQVSRTIADLADRPAPTNQDFWEAYAFVEPSFIRSMMTAGSL